MSANVEITDTFDQWRVKTNEVLVATQTDGSSNFVKLTNTTDSTSNTTGSIITAGGVGIAKNLFVGTDLDVAGTTNLDAIDIDGAVQIDGTLTVGVNDTGYDVKFFGATTGKSLLWDESADSLIVTGTTTLVGTTNLDAVDIDGAVQIDAAFTSGVDGQGYDTKFFGDTASAFMLWDTSADDLILSGAAALSVDNTTDSSSTTTGSIHTDGGVGIAKKLYVGTDLDVNGTTNLDAVDIDGTTQIDATVTVGVNDTGYDVKLFGATAGKSLLWDESADSLIVTGTTTLVGTTNLDAVDIDGAVQIDATVTVGVNDTGYDVKFFGATASAYMLWDESADDLILAGAAALSIDATTDASSTITGSFHTDGGVGIAKKLYVGTDLDVNGTTNLDVVDIDGATQIDATVTVGVDNTGYDVKFFGATAGKYWLWDESADKVIAVSDLQQTGTVTVGVDDTGHDVIFYGAAAGALLQWDESVNALLVRGATADHATTSAGRIVLQTNQAAVVDGDIIGRIDFQPSGETGADALLVTASIYAEADATFDATTNNTELVFAVSAGDAVVEKMRLDSAGKVGIGVTTPASLLHVAGTVQVGVDNTGHDVQFFGATTGKSLLWDESADSLIVTGTTTLVGTTNLDAVDIDGAVQIDAAFTSGVDGQGYDTKFFGDTASAFMLWDTSADDLILSGAAAISIDGTTDASSTTTGTFHTDGGVGIAKKLYVGTDLDVNGTSNLDAVDIDGAVQIDAAFTSGVDGQGYDTKFFGDTASAYLLWDTSVDDLILGGAAGLIVPEGQFTLGSTAVTSTATELNLLDGAGTLKEVGKESIWVPANAMNPTETNGSSALTAVETTSGRPDMQVLDFDKDADEFAQFAIAFPKSWNLGTITYQCFWSGLAATTGVAWSLQGVAMNDNETIDVAYGSAVVVTDDAQGAVEELLVAAESGAVTIAGTPADNDLCYFRIGRDISDGNDDMAGDARLHGIKIFFTTDAANDA
jgi:hypothetical protein